MKFKIEWIENKTSQTSGKPYQVAQVTSEAGETIDKVSIWDIPFGTETLMAGMTVEAELVKSGSFTNLKPVAAARPPMRGGGNPAIKQAMERKDASITKFQENKSDGIRMAATFRDATALTQAYFNGRQPSLEDMQDLWLQMRDWLDQQWDKEPVIKAPF